MVKSERSREILHGGSVGGQKRRSCWQVWRKDAVPLPVTNGSGEAVSVGKKETSLQSECGGVSLGQTPMWWCLSDACLPRR